MLVILLVKKLWKGLWLVLFLRRFRLLDFLVIENSGNNVNNLSVVLGRVINTMQNLVDLYHVSPQSFIF